MSEKIKSYETEELIVYWKSELCEHAGKCVQGAPKVFEVARRPWIMVDQEPMDRVMDVIEQCPSKALSYERKVV